MKPKICPEFLQGRFRLGQQCRKLHELEPPRGLFSYTDDPLESSIFIKDRGLKGAPAESRITPTRTTRTGASEALHFSNRSVDFRGGSKRPAGTATTSGTADATNQLYAPQSRTTTKVSCAYSGLPAAISTLYVETDDKAPISKTLPPHLRPSPLLDVCRYYLRDGGCSRKNCHYLHPLEPEPTFTLSESRSSLNVPKTPSDASAPLLACLKFEKGDCLFGAQCAFLHEIDSPSPGVQGDVDSAGESSPDYYATPSPRPKYSSRVSKGIQVPISECQLFARGLCEKGEGCKFLHGPDEAASAAASKEQARQRKLTKPPKKLAPPPPTPAPSRESSKQLESTSPELETDDDVLKDTSQAPPSAPAATTIAASVQPSLPAAAAYPSVDSDYKAYAAKKSATYPLAMAAEQAHENWSRRIEQDLESYESQGVNPGMAWEADLGWEMFVDKEAVAALAEMERLTAEAGAMWREDEKENERRKNWFRS